KLEVNDSHQNAVDTTSDVAAQDPQREADDPSAQHGRHPYRERESRPIGQPDKVIPTKRVPSEYVYAALGSCRARGKQPVGDVLSIWVPSEQHWQQQPEESQGPPRPHQRQWETLFSWRRSCIRLLRGWIRLNDFRRGVRRRHEGVPRHISRSALEAGASNRARPRLDLSVPPQRQRRARSPE